MTVEKRSAVTLKVAVCRPPCGSTEIFWVGTRAGSAEAARPFMWRTLFPPVRSRWPRVVGCALSIALALSSGTSLLGTDGPGHLAVVQRNDGGGASPSDGAHQPRSHNRARQTGCSRHRGRAGLRRITMCIWRWLSPAAKLIAAIGPSHDRHLPTKKTSRVVHDHGIPDVRLYRGRTEVGAVHHLRNGPLPRAR